MEQLVEKSITKLVGKSVGNSMENSVGKSVKMCHKLSENIWFVWSKRSYSGDKVGVDGRMTEHEDRARILEPEFAIRIQMIFSNRIHIFHIKYISNIILQQKLK